MYPESAAEMSARRDAAEKSPRPRFGVFGYLRDRDTCCCLENPLALANIRSTSAVWSTEAGSVGTVRPFKVGFTAFATPKRILSLNRDFATSRRDARQLLVGQDCVA